MNHYIKDQYRTFLIVHSESYLRNLLSNKDSTQIETFNSKSS